MILLPGGSYVMGCSSPDSPDTRPLHLVEVDSFYLDAHEVTNAQYAAFVSATGYITVAERPLSAEEFPSLTEAQRAPGSIVFLPSLGRSRANSDFWFDFIAGACWRHPQGPGSDLKGLENHPVVHIAYEDALAYCSWAGRRLPTEAEWEYAARAGLQEGLWYWGDSLQLQGRWMANTFQGEFPEKDSGEDGFAGTAPVGSFPPSAWGLYDMSGNVWEWCADFYDPYYYRVSSTRNPPGPAASFDPEEPGLIKRVLRGGSFLCSPSYCRRYMAGYRNKAEINSSAQHTGFRCAASLRP